MKGNSCRTIHILISKISLRHSSALFSNPKSCSSKIALKKASKSVRFNIKKGVSSSRSLETIRVGCDQMKYSTLLVLDNPWKKI